MKYRLNIAWWMAVAIVIGLLVTGANAQVIAKDAKFTLPFKANWEGRVLPPGDYTMWVSRIEQHAYRVDIRREGFQHTMVVLETPGAEVGKQAALVAEVRGLKVSVRELHLPKANLVLKFPELKNAKTGTAVAKVDPDTPPVPVLIALK